MEQAEFLEKLSEIQTNLAGAVIESLPEDWDVAELVLGPAIKEGETKSMRHELRNPQLTSGVLSVIADDEVFVHTGEMELLFREYGAAWKQAIMRVTWEDADDQWRFVMDYEYDE